METTSGNITGRASALRHEVNRLQALIDKREKWLNTPENRFRRTWVTVRRDTMQMAELQEELQEELDRITNH